MKCCSRSTLGVIIGALNIIAYSFATIVAILLTDRGYVYIEIALFAYVLSAIFAFSLVVASILLIIGILKRRHSLMAPWLILSAISFVICCVKVLFDPFAHFGDIRWYYIILEFILEGIITGIQGIILIKIYALYKDIRDKNNARPGQFISEGQVATINGYPTQTVGQVASNNGHPTQTVYYSAIPDKD